MMEPYTPIKGIEFEIYDNNKVKKYSVMEEGIKKHELYENQKPRAGGLIDTRMGTTTDNNTCQTCNLNYIDCPGHFGHIVLGGVEYHIGLFNYVKKILSCICIKCGNFRTSLSNNELENKLRKYEGKNRLEQLILLCKDAKQCGVCKAILPKIKSIEQLNKGIFDIYIEYPDKEEKLNCPINPETVLKILEKIPREKLKYFGFKDTKPEDLLYINFPVPPMHVRPSVKVEGLVGNIKIDDLTSYLSEIVRNNKLLTDLNNNPEKIELQKNYRKLLQIALIKYYDNEIKDLPGSASDKGKSLTSRLKTKEGRFRSNLMGKRVDYSARSVISPDTCISINEVRIPLVIAKTLSFGEMVTPYNIDELNKYVLNGPDNYPGANIVHILRDDGNYNHMSLSYTTKPIILKPGDIVDRHLIDGDIVLFNRQPSLHKYSMMGHYVKVMTDPRFISIGLNLGVTEPYHADFDGDEMNITIPRSIQSKIELEELAAVNKLLVNAQTSKPVYGCKMDAVVGTYIITSNDKIKIPKHIVMNLISNLNSPIDKSYEFTHINKDFYTGKEVFSLIIPKKITIIKPDVKIINGELIEGSINKKYLKDGETDSLLRLVEEFYNADEMKKFFDNAQTLINNFFLWFGYTTSCKDISISKDLKDQIQTMIKNVLLKSNELTTDIENDPSSCSSDIYEMKMTEKLSNIRTDIGDFILKNFDLDNNLNIMKNSGSSGKIKPDSISKNIAVEGQQATKGGRFNKNLNRRVYPYFNQDLNTAYERGFNQHGFYDGLTFTEFLNNAITAREGLIKIQLNTADSGYVEHKIVKSLEDIHVAYDNTVRDVNDNIIQFIYGDSGINPIYLYDYTMKSLGMNDEELKNNFTFTKDEIKDIKNYNDKNNDDFYNKLKELRDYIRKVKINSNINNLEITKFKVPLNIIKINSVINGDKKKGNLIECKYILDKIEEFLNHNNSKFLLGYEEKKNSLLIKDENCIKNILKLMLYETFAPKKCILTYKITKELFDNIMENLKNDLQHHIIDAGEMVGCLAAQSICENITQTNLNSHHLTGVGSKTATTTGFKRITEILNNTKENSTPGMIIRLDKDHLTDKIYGEKISTYLKQTILSEVRDIIEIYYDPKVEHKKKDRIGRTFNLTSEEQNDKLPWLIKIHFNREELLLKNIELRDILVQFVNEIDNNTNKKLSFLSSINKYSISCNDTNDIDPMIHLRLKLVNYKIETLHKIVDDFIDNIKLKGMKNIRETSLEDDTIISIIDKDNSIKNIKEYIIKTAGENILDIRNIKFIDPNKSITNNIDQIYHLFGIEAAKTAIINELMKETGYNISYNHLSILIDYMTRNGFIISVDRNGLKKIDGSLLSKISFEKPIEQIMTAAVFNEKDDCVGVSSRIMTGQIINGGTGAFKLVLNTNMIMNSEYTINSMNTSYNVFDDNVLINNVINDDDKNIDDDYILFDDDD